MSGLKYSTFLDCYSTLTLAITDIILSLNVLVQSCLVVCKKVRHHRAPGHMTTSDDSVYIRSFQKERGKDGGAELDTE